jgi:hypothetical protein
LAQANNTLAEISKAIERRCSHIAGIHLPLPTNWSASARPGCCQSRYRLRDLRTRDVYRLRASSSCQPQVQHAAGVFSEIEMIREGDAVTSAEIAMLSVLIVVVVVSACLAFLNREF